MLFELSEGQRAGVAKVVSEIDISHLDTFAFELILQICEIAFYRVVEGENLTRHIKPESADLVIATIWSPASVVVE